jgi:hypothetical protein
LAISLCSKDCDNETAVSYWPPAVQEIESIIGKPVFQHFRFLRGFVADARSEIVHMRVLTCRLKELKNTILLFVGQPAKYIVDITPELAGVAALCNSAREGSRAKLRLDTRTPLVITSAENSLR